MVMHLFHLVASLALASASASSPEATPPESPKESMEYFAWRQHTIPAVTETRCTVISRARDRESDPWKETSSVSATGAACGQPGLTDSGLSQTETVGIGTYEIKPARTYNSRDRVT